MRKPKEDEIDKLREWNRILKLKERMREADERKLRILHKVFHCYFCGSKNRVHLHHILPSKDNKVINWDWSQEKVENEVEKCVPLCRSCHEKLHHMYQLRPVSHGTNFAYEVYHCRCDLCCNAHVEAANYVEKLRTMPCPKKTKG